MIPEMLDVILKWTAWLPQFAEQLRDELRLF